MNSDSRLLPARRPGLLLVVLALLSIAAGPAIAQQNQIYIDQVGTTQAGSNLQLTAVQIGTSNTIAGSNPGSTQINSLPFAILSGDGQQIVVEQFGSGNSAFLDIIGDNATITAVAVGNDNLVRLECSDGTQTCASTSIDLNLTGDTNTIDYLIGDGTATSNIAMTFSINGSGNSFIDVADYDAVSNSAESLVVQQRTVTTDVTGLARDAAGDLTFATTGTTLLAATDFARTNSIDGANHNLDVVLFGDANTFTTEVAGTNHTLSLAVDSQAGSVVSVRMAGDNSTVDLRLDGDNADVAVISANVLAR